MSAGRPRKPDEVHILEGTFRADRHGDPAASVVADGEPVPPRHLKGVALAFWREVVPGLVDSGIAKARDAFELAAMCEWWAQYRKARQALDKMAIINKAYPRINLLAAVAFEKFDRVAARFGLTPSDRGRLRLPAEKKVAGVMSRKRC